MKTTLPDINHIVAQAEGIIASANNEADIYYFKFHKNRYAHTLRAVLNLLPAGSLVVDVGSHYLHQSLLLRLAGYRVIGVDVPVFSTINFIAERAKNNQIENLALPQLENGLPAEIKADSIDLILFTEIFEHITFNPVLMWRSMYEKLTVGGKIYISTPNSLNLFSWVNHLKNLLFFQSVGLHSDGIFGTVTYGHHWKEYSAYEVKRYFKQLSPDFSVKINYYHYRNENKSQKQMKYAFAEKIRNIGNFFGGVLSEEMEIVVFLPQKTVFLRTTPSYF